MSEYTGLGPLPEGERMDAYFYSFTPTGVALIDSILSAVAVAGKGSYYTEDWDEPDDYYGYYDRLGFTDVSSAVDLIQRTADRAADAVREWHRDEMASEGDDWEDEGWTDAPAVIATPGWGPDRGVSERTWLSEIIARLEAVEAELPYEDKDRHAKKSAAWSNLYQHAPTDMRRLIAEVARLETELANKENHD